MIPAKTLAQIPNRKEAEDDERNRLLDDFELDCGIVSGANAPAIGGNHQAIFEESDSPTGEDNFPEGHLLVFEVTIPSKRHEDIAGGEKKDRR